MTALNVIMGIFSALCFVHAGFEFIMPEQAMANFGSKDELCRAAFFNLDAVIAANVFMGTIMAYGITMNLDAKRKIMRTVGVYGLVLGGLMFKMVGDTDYSYISIAIVWLISLVGFSLGFGSNPKSIKKIK